MCFGYYGFFFFRMVVSRRRGFRVVSTLEFLFGVVGIGGFLKLLGVGKAVRFVCEFRRG